MLVGAARMNRVAVVVPTPAHSGLAGALSYRFDRELTPGTLVRVPLGRREVLGVVWDQEDTRPDEMPAVEQLKPLTSVLDSVPPLSAAWRGLIAFAARYYQRSLGEMALSVLPPALRDASTQQIERRLSKRMRATDANDGFHDAIENVALTEEQKSALAQFHTEAGPFLLYGVTGSGKTEVYLQAAQAVLRQDPTAQVLLLVPEINLTPQLEARLRDRFGAAAVVSLHSGMTPPQRLNSWLAAHFGSVRIVLGTRLAVFASLPGLKLLVVDEEHDPSYKSQDGARYSARDLAVLRGKLDGAKVLLGSATPSLESWRHSEPLAAPDAAAPRYRRLLMPSRIAQGALPTVRRIDLSRQPKNCVLAPPLIEAIGQRLARGEQAMLLLNRRGYAPVLHCADCGWQSECPNCSAWRVFHKIDRSLRCHHCGLSTPVPRACPACGNLDVAPMGRGTERIEEIAQQLLAPLTRPDGGGVRVQRIDADSTRAKGALEAQLGAVHAGEVDVLVGTQMIAKGHDFRRVTLVAAVNPDGALFSSDFRAAERLFALLMQAAGRAGRDAAQASGSEMWVQSHYPRHPLYAALARHDYVGFANEQLAERAQAGMPPFSSQALLRADAKSQDIAQAFLNEASAVAAQLGPMAELVQRFPAVPLAIQRVANVERAQLLLEAGTRAALQRFLAAWQPLLHETRGLPAHRGVIRWAIDVDPLAI